MAIEEIRFVNIHKDLIEGCKRGDSKSQFKIYKLYFKAMFNTCYRILKDKTEAEDVMQDAFLAAFQKIDTFSGKVSFGAWLKKIVINRSIDALKLQKAKYESIEDIQLSEMHEDTKDDDYVTTFSMDQIVNAIQSLPKGYRVVTSLYLIEGYDHEEIGQILGIESSASRSQYTRARKKLVAILKQPIA